MRIQIAERYDVHSMFTLDDIHVYILNWKKVNANSVLLYTSIQPIVRNTYIINCDENFVLDPSIQHIQLDDSCYYGAQFKTAITHVQDNKLFCVIVGDNKPDNDFSKIFSAALNAFNNHRIGVYTPHDKRSVHQHVVDTYKDQMYNVVNTDCGFWFIHPKIYKGIRNLDFTVSKYGWGIDTIVIKEANKFGMLVISDHSIETDQLDHTCGYNIKDAANEGAKLMRLYSQLAKNTMMPFMRRRHM